MRKTNLIAIGIFVLVVCSILTQIIIAQTGSTPAEIIYQTVVNKDGSTSIFCKSEGAEQELLAKFPPDYKVNTEYFPGGKVEMIAKNTGTGDDAVEFKNMKIKAAQNTEIEIFEKFEGSYSFVTIENGGDIEIDGQNFNIDSYGEFKTDKDNNLVMANFATKKPGPYNFKHNNGDIKFTKFVSEEPTQIIFDSEIYDYGLGGEKIRIEGGRIRGGGGGLLSFNSADGAVQNIKITDNPDDKILNAFEFDYDGKGKIKKFDVSGGGKVSFEEIFNNKKDIKPELSSAEDFEVLFDKLEESNLANNIFVSETGQYELNGKVKFKDFERQYRGFESASASVYNPMENSIYFEGNGAVANGQQAVYFEGDKANFVAKNFVSQTEALKVEHHSLSNDINLILGKQSPDSGISAIAYKDAVTDMDVVVVDDIESYKKFS